MLGPRGLPRGSPSIVETRTAPRKSQSTQFHCWLHCPRPWARHGSVVEGEPCRDPCERNVAGKPQDIELYGAAGGKGRGCHAPRPGGWRVGPEPCNLGPCHNERKVARPTALCEGVRTVGRGPFLTGKRVAWLIAVSRQRTRETPGGASARRGGGVPGARSCRGTARQSASGSPGGSDRGDAHITRAGSISERPMLRHSPFLGDRPPLWSAWPPDGDGDTPGVGGAPTG